MQIPSRYVVFRCRSIRSHVAVAIGRWRGCGEGGNYHTPGRLSPKPVYLPVTAGWPPASSRSLGVFVRRTHSRRIGDGSAWTGRSSAFTAEGGTEQAGAVAGHAVLACGPARRRPAALAVRPAKTARPRTMRIRVRQNASSATRRPRPPGQVTDGDQPPAWNAPPPRRSRRNGRLRPWAIHRSGNALASGRFRPGRNTQTRVAAAASDRLM